ncbi:MAG: cytochrome c oxidase subunit II, partial [Nanoarchaeota archaeon]
EKMNKKIVNVFLIVLLNIVLLAGAGCSGSTNKGAVTVEIIDDQTPEVNNGDSAQEVKEFTLTAKQWEFDPETITANKGDKVKLNIKSLDVTHGFAIPEFGVNSRLESGRTTTVEFVADKTGTFTFFCSVQCGAGHSDMKGQLIVN